MRTKVFFTVLILLLGATYSFAQKIKKREIDKFTKSEIIETSGETLYSVYITGIGYGERFEFQIIKVNGEYAMPANIFRGEVVKYVEGDGVTFLLENGETVDLISSYTGVGGSRLGKAYYFQTSFNIPAEAVEKLKNHKVTDVRIRYMGGSYDRELKPKKQQLIMKMLKLLEK
jgi:hypothetical protein